MADRCGAGRRKRDDPFLLRDNRPLALKARHPGIERLGDAGPSLVLLRIVSARAFSRSISAPLQSSGALSPGPFGGGAPT